MAHFVTNRGITRLLEAAVLGTWNGGAIPASWRMMLATAAQTPVPTTDFFSELTEIVAGNGYASGGVSIPLGVGSGWSVTIDDAGNGGILAAPVVQVVAAGGAIPSSGNPVRWIVITDANATIADREVLAVIDPGAAFTASNGQAISLGSMEIEGTQ